MLVIQAFDVSAGPDGLKQETSGTLNLQEWNGRLLERFAAWLKANGAQFDKVKPVWSESTGFTLRAVEDCAQGETIVQMPISLFLGPKAVEKSWLRSLLAPLPIPEQVHARVLARRLYRAMPV